MAQDQPLASKSNRSFVFPLTSSACSPQRRRRSRPRGRLSACHRGWGGL